MSLKDTIQNDIGDIFFQVNDFGEEHLIENKKVVIIIDDDQLVTMKNSGILDVSESDTLFFMKEEEMKEKVPGSNINIDGKECIVDSWKNNFGVYQVSVHHVERGWGS